MTLATVPNTMTGPAITNILASRPKTYPSACVNIGHSELANIFKSLDKLEILPYNFT